MKTYARFAVLVVAIIGTLVWLGYSGINESKTYYKTISELKTVSASQRVRVTGDVVPGSIRREGDQVRFVIHEKENNLSLNVVYTGKDPLPDTFRDNAQAMADGKMQPDGTFHAKSIAAKCPSKYEAKPGGIPVQAPLQQKSIS